MFLLRKEASLTVVMTVQLIIIYHLNSLVDRIYPQYFLTYHREKVLTKNLASCRRTKLQEFIKTTLNTYGSSTFSFRWLSIHSAEVPHRTSFQILSLILIYACNIFSQIFSTLFHFSHWILTFNVGIKVHQTPVRKELSFWQGHVDYISNINNALPNQKHSLRIFLKRFLRNLEFFLPIDVQAQRHRKLKFEI